jgi:hypothetical protein
MGLVARQLADKPTGSRHMTMPIVSCWRIVTVKIQRRLETLVRARNRAETSVEVRAERLSKAFAFEAGAVAQVQCREASIRSQTQCGRLKQQRSGLQRIIAGEFIR